MEFRNREIKCADCGEFFEFTTGEQEFYKKKGFMDPKRCKDCRRIRRESKEDSQNA